MPVSIAHTHNEYFYLLRVPALKTQTYTSGTVFCTNNGYPKGFTITDTNLRFVFTGESQAVSISKTLDANPSEFGEIPLSAIAPNVIMSRQLVGTSYQLSLVTYNGLSYPEYIVSKGVIGEIKRYATKYSLELVSNVEKLRTDERYKVASSCMNNIGEGKCPIAKNPEFRWVTGLATPNTLNLLTPFVPVTNEQYEVLIGTSRYLVDLGLTAASTLGIVGYLDTYPEHVTIQRHCNLTLDQCKLYGALDYFNGNPLLKAEAVNIAV